MLAALLRMLFLCEVRGEWPRAAALTVIALIPKPEGGRWPIVLLALCPRVWMRIRHCLVKRGTQRTRSLPIAIINLLIWIGACV